MDKCSFCGREKSDTNLLIAGISGHICDSCVEQAHDIVLDENNKKSDFDIDKIKLLKPSEFSDRIALNLESLLNVECGRCHK